MAAALTDAILLGAVTGMRSMSGLTAAGLVRRRWWASLAGAAAAAEMIADKTPYVGDRIDPLPLVGRAALGAMAGVIVADERDDDRVRCALAGAVTALVSAHLAYRIRRRLPVSNLAKGLLEDAVVVALSDTYARRARRSEVVEARPAAL